MGSNTSYNRWQRVSAKVGDIFAAAKIYNPTHATLLDQLSKVYSSKDYAKLTQYQRGYIHGKIDASFTEIRLHYTVWHVRYQGKLTPSSEVPNGEWSKVETGDHVWKSDTSRIY